MMNKFIDTRQIFKLSIWKYYFEIGKVKRETSDIDEFKKWLE